MRGVLHELLFSEFIIEESVNHDRYTGENNVVHLVNIGLVQRLAREHREDTVPELRYYIQHVLVESPADKVRVPAVALASVNEEKRKEFFELTERVVATPGSLHAFMASYSDSDMCFVDHSHVVSSITDG